jgi:hypothetical protein
MRNLLPDPKTEPADRPAGLATWREAVTEELAVSPEYGPGPSHSEPWTSPGWHWLEVENRQVDAMDFSSFDFRLGLHELLAGLALIVAATTALTAWLIGGS